MKANLNGFGDGEASRGIRREKSGKLEKFEMLINKIEALIDTGFTGYVKINFSQGSIGRVEKFEEILKELKVK
ncbi:MAG: hypothetical protein JW944_02020 [Deltaproteobacteria bacterium]|nr:hypothetical protein [Deltaproteobacteria bacterium]